MHDRVACSVNALRSVAAAVCAVQVRTSQYGGVPVVLKEGALGDGVGAKVWTVAHTLCR